MIKICGITNIDDATAACEYGADAIGFIFSPSPRRVSANDARRITSRLPAGPLKTGIFTDRKLAEVQAIIEDCGLDCVQLHGYEDSVYCEQLEPKVIKAFRVENDDILKHLPRYHTFAFLLDSYSPIYPGGTGRTFNWEIAIRAKRYGRIILSGGLTPDNVLDAITRVRPYGVDTCSGVESSPGRKNHKKMQDFIAIAKGAMK
jgi:phosphoribosylanthranilate isomerase